MMKKIRLTGGKVFTEPGIFEERDVFLFGDRFVSREEYVAAEAAEEVIGCSKDYVIPGLTDIHLHGAAGWDCCDGTEEAFAGIARYEAQNGVTTITPATMTIPEEQLVRTAEAAKRYCLQSAGGRARVEGLYMEGPFLSPAKKGAQKEEDLRLPDAEWFRRMQERSGSLFRTVALAPELDGASAFLEALKDEVRISAAHTGADYDTAANAFRMGIRQLTHLFNAMPSLHHRAPGPIAAAAENPDVMAELICDGIHVHPAMVRLAFSLFGDDRIILISDSMRAAGLPDGESELGGQKVFKEGKRAYLADQTLAGSVTNLMDCMRCAVLEMQIPLESAVKCAAVNPAKSLGIYPETGKIAPGSFADLCILDADLALKEVICRGERSSI